MTAGPRERALPFRSVANFRDIGGYACGERGTVRWGAVYRAGVLDGMDEVDRDTYLNLGVRTVFDLRSDDECAARPSVDGAHRIEISSRPPTPTTTPTVPIVESGPLPDLREVYVGMLDHGRDGFAQLFTTLARHDALPAVIHCHAGKDRTGMVVALLLEVIGVDRELVLDDYEISPPLTESDGATTERLLAYGYEPAAAAAMLVASRPAMTAALEHLDDRYGGAIEYLRRAGVVGGDLVQLRDALVDPSV
jgi:protein-tyrosine phosphatase